MAEDLLLASPINRLSQVVLDIRYPHIASVLGAIGEQNTNVVLLGQSLKQSQQLLYYLSMHMGLDAEARKQA